MAEHDDYFDPSADFDNPSETEEDIVFRQKIDALEAERNLLSQMVAEAETECFALITSRGTPTDIKGFNELTRKYNSLVDYVPDVPRVKVDYRSEGLFSQLEKFAEARVFEDALRIGKKIALRETFMRRLEMLQQMTQTQEEQDQLARYARLYGLVNYEQFVPSKRGVSLVDFKNKLPKDPEKRVAHYNFILSVALIDAERDDSGDDFEIDPELKTLAPLSVQELPDDLSAAYDIRGVHASKFLYYLQAHRKQTDTDIAARNVAERAETFVANLQKATKECMQVLFRPDSEEFELMIPQFEGFLAQDDRTRHLFINFFESTFNTFKLYRTAMQMSGHPQYGDFYAQLADAIREDALAYPYANIITADNLEEVTREDAPEQESPFHAGEFQKKTAAYIQKQKKSMDLDIKDVNSIDWGIFVTPHHVHFGYDAAKRIVTLKLFYLNDQTEEHTQIGFFVGAKTGSFDWNILETPDEPRFEKAQQSLLASMSQILNTISIQPPKEVQNISLPAVPKVKRERIEDESYELKRTRRSWAPVRENRGEGGEIIKERGPVKYTIDVSQQAELDRMLEKFNAQQREAIMAGILGFNNRKPGDRRGIEPLNSTGLDVDSSDRLRIYVPAVKGGVRVLLEREGKTYRIVDLERRSKIYASHGL